MRMFSVVMTYVTLGLAMCWYCPLIARREVKPVPATWIIACIAINIIAWAGYHNPAKSFADNAGVYAAAVEITMVLIVVLAVLGKDRRLTVAFNPAQKISLVIMAGILTYWYDHRDQKDTVYWCTEILMSLAYVPTCIAIWESKKVLDSIGNWMLVWAGALVGLIPATISGDPYALGNSARAVICGGITVWLFTHFDKKTGWKQLRREVAVIKDFYKQLVRYA